MNSGILGSLGLIGFAVYLVMTNQGDLTPLFYGKVGGSGLVGLVGLLYNSKGLMGKIKYIMDNNKLFKNEPELSKKDEVVEPSPITPNKNQKVDLTLQDSIQKDFECLTYLTRRASSKQEAVALLKQLNDLFFDIHQENTNA